MDELELRAMMIEVIENHFCCSGTECEAGYCRPRLIRIEERLEHAIDGTARGLNWIVAHLKEEKANDQKH